MTEQTLKVRDRLLLSDFAQLRFMAQNVLVHRARPSG